MVAPSMLRPVPAWQVRAASLLALGWTVVTGATASTRVIALLPEGSARRFLQKVHELCKESPSLDCVRIMSVMLAWYETAIAGSVFVQTISCMCLTRVWRYSVVIKNVSIVDIMWGLMFLVQAFSYGSHGEADKNGYPGRKSLTLAMTSTYALRLGTFLYWRNHVSPIGVGVSGGSAEDFR